MPIGGLECAADRAGVAGSLQETRQKAPFLPPNKSRDHFIAFKQRLYFCTL